MPASWKRLFKQTVYFLIAGGMVLCACQPSGNKTENSPAATLFKSKCHSCHALPKPGDKTDEQLAAILEKHRARVKLTEEQRQMILRQLSGQSLTDSI